MQCLSTFDFYIVLNNYFIVVPSVLILGVFAINVCYSARDLYERKVIQLNMTIGKTPASKMMYFHSLDLLYLTAKTSRLTHFNLFQLLPSSKCLFGTLM